MKSISMVAVSPFLKTQGSSVQLEMRTSRSSPVPLSEFSSHQVNSASLDAECVRSSALPSFGRSEGGTISGDNTLGKSLPWIFCWISHMARANCSLFNFPVWPISHNALKRNHKYCLLPKTYFLLPYQIPAKTGCGRRDCKNTPLISLPDT